MGLATTTLRIGLGTLMAGHGLQKLAGKFGGPGLEETAAGFEHIGFHPGRPYATAAALSETVGGSLLAAGLFTPLGAAMVTGAMTVAIGKVHAKNGLWVTKGGAEYNLVLIGAAFAVTEHGPGFPALDGLITKRRKGFVWAILELGVGVASGLAVMSLASRTAGDPAGAGADAAVTGEAVEESAPTPEIIVVPEVVIIASEEDVAPAGETVAPAEIAPEPAADSEAEQVTS